MAAIRVLRLRAATFEARGVIAGIANCAAGGVLSPEAMRELNDFYLYRVELPLHTASVLQSSAQTIRLLVRAIRHIGRGDTTLRQPGDSMYGGLTRGPTTLPR